MAEISGETPFGNYVDPFNEAPEPGGYMERIDNVRLCAAELIMMMAKRCDKVQTEDIGDGLVARTLDFKCGAPFIAKFGLCTNDFRSRIRGRYNSKDVGRAEMAIQVGDTVGQDGVTERWVRLARQDGDSFGVTGLSREPRRGKFEKWQALTMRVRSDGGEVTADLWADVTDADGIAHSAPLRGPSHNARQGYYDSLTRAIARTHKKPPETTQI